MRPLSIRLSLTVWYGAMFAAAAILLSLSSWWMLQRSLRATEYHELQERAEDVQLLLQQLGPGASQELLERKFLEIYKVKDDGKYLQISDDAGRWIYRSKRMIEWDVPLAAAGSLPADGVSSVLHRGARNVSVLAYPITANGRAYAVETGLSLSGSTTLLSAFTTQMLLLTPAVLLLAAIGGHFMSRKALAPVAAIATEARRINDRNLDIRLPVCETGDEISHLSETLNQMLGRVESGVRSIREFTANAAHELRTPLALIRAEVEVALSLPRSAEEYREACEQVQHASVRMTGLIDNLLMLARVDAGTEILRFEPIDASQMVHQVGDTWKTAMRLALLDFSVETEPAPTILSGDLDGLQRMLTILLDNALRYTAPGGSVRLSAAREQGNIVFIVRDTGIGIAPEHQSRIFNRFYRINHHPGGSGLGLSLAEWIAEKHSTRITIESALGAGALFQFAIAEAPAPASPTGFFEEARATVSVQSKI